MIAWSALGLRALGMYKIIYVLTDKWDCLGMALIVTWVASPQQWCIANTEDNLTKLATYLQND